MIENKVCNIYFTKVFISPYTIGCVASATYELFNIERKHYKKIKRFILPELNFGGVLNEGLDFVVVSVGQVRNGDDEQEGKEDADGTNDQER